MNKPLKISDAMTVKQVAAHCGVTVGRVRQWVMEGKLEGIKLNGAWLFNRKDVLAFDKVPRQRGNPAFQSS